MSGAVCLRPSPTDGVRAAASLQPALRRTPHPQQKGSKRERWRMDGGCLSGMRRRTRRRRIAATRHGVRRLEGLDPFFPGGSPAAPPDAALHLCAKQRLLPPQRPARSNCERGAPERDARQALESHCAAHESWSVRHGCRLRLAVLHSTGAWRLENALLRPQTNKRRGAEEQVQALRRIRAGTSSCAMAALARAAGPAAAARGCLLSCRPQRE